VPRFLALSVLGLSRRPCRRLRQPVYAQRVAASPRPRAARPRSRRAAPLVAESTVRRARSAAARAPPGLDSSILSPPPPLRAAASSSSSTATRRCTFTTCSSGDGRRLRRPRSTRTRRAALARPVATHRSGSPWARGSRLGGRAGRAATSASSVVAGLQLFTSWRRRRPCRAQTRRTGCTRWWTGCDGDVTSDFLLFSLSRRRFCVCGGPI